MIIFGGVNRAGNVMLEHRIHELTDGGADSRIYLAKQTIFSFGAGQRRRGLNYLIIFAANYRALRARCALRL